MLLARRFLIVGRVSGDRFYAEDAARREGLHGFVRNLPDGAVEVVAEGDAERWIGSSGQSGGGREGPGRARRGDRWRAASGRATGLRLRD